MGFEPDDMVECVERMDLLILKAMVDRAKAKSGFVVGLGGVGQIKYAGDSGQFWSPQVFGSERRGEITAIGGQ